MAGITSKGMYGLAAMYTLMRIGQGKPVQIREIAENANIPQNYLEQLLVMLRRSGFVQSIRGAHGGYMLARNPEEIVIYDILESLEGGLCLSTVSTGNEVLALFWEAQQKKVREIFGLSLWELEKFEQEYYQQMMYTI